MRARATRACFHPRSRELAATRDDGLCSGAYESTAAPPARRTVLTHVPFLLLLPPRTRMYLPLAHTTLTAPELLRYTPTHPDVSASNFPLPKQPLRSVAKDINLVLLSHPDLAHLGALPYAVANVRTMLVHRNTLGRHAILRSPHVMICCDTPPASCFSLCKPFNTTYHTSLS